MDPGLIAKSLCFHGQPLQKIWEGERGNNDLNKLGISNPDYSVYTQRQKNLTFQDRAKRLRLHQFLARKAEDLFNSKLVDKTNPNIKPKSDGPPNTTVVMPPFEIFVNKNIDKSKHLHCILEAIKPGDIVYGTIMSRSASGLLVKVVCTGEPLVRYLFEIKAFVLAQNIIPAVDKKGNARLFAPNDHVCCEVIDISVDADRMTLGMKGSLTTNSRAPLGLISMEQYPEYYKRMIDDPRDSYEDYLKSSKQFENPSDTDALYQAVGLDINHSYSNMRSLKDRFPQAEYAVELRQLQASKWAFRSVADGIEHFKIGRHTEAFQCLNKALNIDPCNVEGLVARGALYANSGSFQKAVQDFETALKLNPYHANARRYMGETLVALGRSYEEEQRYSDARKAYNSCLDIIPTHEEAKSSLDTLNLNRPPHLGDSAFNFPDPISSNLNDVPYISPSLNDKRNHKYNDIKETSSSSESGSGTSDDNSSISSNSKLSDKEKKRKNFRESLSPLSKRMVKMEPSESNSYQFNQPFHLATAGKSSSSTIQDYDNKYHEMMDYREDDYEDRVKKLLEETTKHRKECEELFKSKEKKKSKREEDTKANKKDKYRDKEPQHHGSFDEINNLQLEENVKNFEPPPPINDIESKQNDNFHKYDENIHQITKRHEQTYTNQHMFDVHKISTPSTTYNRQSSPYLHLNPNEFPTPVPSMHMVTASSVPYNSNIKSDGMFKPFPIKAPIVLDKFGCFRLATAPEEEIKKLDRNSYRSKSRSRSRGRRVRSRSRSRSRNRRSRTRSRSRRRFRSRSRSRHYSRSPVRRTRAPRSRSRRRSRSCSLPARRTPSPFVPRNTPPPPRYRRSRSPFRGNYRGSYRGSFRSFHSRGRGRGRARNFYSFVKKRSPLSRNRSGTRSRSRSRSFSRSRSRSISFEEKHRRSTNYNANHKSGLNSRWSHDKFVKDDPTIEEIDEIINKAQRDRKKEIIQRDRNIVKNK